MTADIHPPAGIPTPTTALPVGVRYLPNVVSATLQAHAWRELLSDPHTFGPSQVHVEGQWHDAPRLVASFAEAPVHMKGMPPSLPWPESLDRIRGLAADISGHEFNYGLANLYRDGDDYAGWHADKAAMHHPGSIIAIVSLGAVRTLEFRQSTGTTGPSSKSSPGPGGGVHSLDGPAAPSPWEHRVPPTTDQTPPRVSVTLRSIPMDDGRAEPTESSRPAGR